MNFKKYLVVYSALYVLLWVLWSIIWIGYPAMQILGAIIFIFFLLWCIPAPKRGAKITPTKDVGGVKISGAKVSGVDIADITVGNGKILIRGNRMVGRNKISVNTGNGIRIEVNERGTFVNGQRVDETDER